MKLLVCLTDRGEKAKVVRVKRLILTVKSMIISVGAVQWTLNLFHWSVAEDAELPGIVEKRAKRPIGQCMDPGVREGRARGRRNRRLRRKCRMSFMIWTS